MLIDWSQEPVFLEQELRQATRRAKLKKTAVDKLVRVRLIKGGMTTLLVHVEFQNQKEPDLPLRLYTYNTSIFSLLQQPLITVAVLGDRNPNWRPPGYGYGIGDFETRMQFPIVKLLDYEDQWEMLESSTNPFAVVVMAHLKGMATQRRPQSRLEWKLNLTKALFERNLDIDQMYQLIDFIDWLMVLDDRREARFDAALRTIEEEYQMPTLPPRQVRLIARNRQEAELEGQLTTLRTTTVDVLEIRFGTVPADIMEQLNQIDAIPHLRDLHRVAVRTTSIDEFRTYLA